MPVPDFTDYGMLPAGIHQCTLPEAQEVLCTNDHRSLIWQGLLNFIDWIAALPQPTALLIDGSYVTDKPVPGDVDVVVDITLCDEVQQHEWIAAWAENRQFVKDTFHVDFYPFVVGLGNDFAAFFQYVRIEDALRRGIPPAVRKGVLRVQQ